MATKLAFATDDGEMIHSHFGRAQYYEIIELGEEGIVGRCRVPKFSPHVNPGLTQLGENDRHAGMFQPLAGVNLLIARGMGMGAITGAHAVGVEVVLCDARTIAEAVALYQTGELFHNEQRVHLHHPHHEHHDHE